MTNIDKMLRRFKRELAHLVEEDTKGSNGIGKIYSECLHTDKRNRRRNMEKILVNFEMQYEW